MKRHGGRVENAPEGAKSAQGAFFDEMRGQAAQEKSARPVPNQASQSNGGSKAGAAPLMDMATCNLVVNLSDN